MTLREALLRAFEGKEEKQVGAVADTWLFSGFATHNPHALIAAKWLNQQGIRIVITWEVEHEYQNFYTTAPHILDSEGVPKGPVNIEAMIDGVMVGFWRKKFTEHDRIIRENQKMSLTDKLVALEAMTIAERHGRCYLITNDTELIGKSGERFGRIVEEQGLNITIVMPSYIEQNLHHLLPELELKLMLPSHVLASLYQLGMGEQKIEGVPYILMQRAQKYALGKTAITADIATEVLFTESSGKKVPHRTTTYGIPVVAVSQANHEEVEEAALSLKPQIPGGISGFAFAVLPEDRKYLPNIYRLRREKNDGQLAIFYERLAWGRLPDHTPRTASR